MAAQATCGRRAAQAARARGGGSRRETTFETPLPAIETP